MFANSTKQSAQGDEDATNNGGRGVVTAQVVSASDDRDGAAAPACTFTRQELQDLLKEARYGAEQGPYNAYFRQDGDGGHVCRACGLVIGLHSTTAPTTASPAGAASAPAAAGDAATLEKVPRPTVRVDEIATAFPDHGFGRVVPRPRHWTGGGSWYMNFLEFDGFGGLHQELVGSRKHRRLQTNAQTRWRCVAPNADHTGPCGETFLTKGVALDSQTLRPAHGAIADMSVVHAGEHAMRDHFTNAHQLESTSAGGWSTALGDVCADPVVALACLTCPFALPSFCVASTGRGFCNALNAAAPRDDSSQTVVASADPDGIQCSGGCWCSHIVMLPFVPHLVFMSVFTFVGSIITLCGFPCDSDSLPPLLLCCCYNRRRSFVKALGADETPMQTRCYTVFCCPCSELQQFRELRNSGIWPGLMCCTASDEDKAIMQPSAVRARYSVDGAYGVRARAGGGPLAQRTASLIDEFPGPVVCWRMR